MTAAWLPFFALWLSFAMSSSTAPFLPLFVTSLVEMGTAGLLAVPVWFVSKRWPWPFGFELRFYLLQILLAALYGLLWMHAVFVCEFFRLGASAVQLWTSSNLGRHMYLGFWFYTIAAGISQAIQTRDRLHEKEILASAARLDAIRTRLNPHFLFNALHTLGALVSFQPAQAEKAIERLGDMLRYTLREDGRDLVEFSEEYEFTRQYLAFEQLRYEDRLKVDLQIDPGAFDFEVPPFSLQTLTENAVRHAISIRPEGGSIWIACSCSGDQLTLRVRDDGSGSSADAGPSHQFGLRSLRERLEATYGSRAELQVASAAGGFEASFTVPARNGES